MNGRRFAVGCDLEYQVLSPTVFILNVEAARSGYQSVVREELSLDPAIEPERFETPETGNRNLRFTIESGAVRVRYSAIVETAVRDLAHAYEVAPALLPPHTLPYLLPSRYCQSDKLVRLARHFFGENSPGHPRVGTICDWIFENVEYLRGATNTHTSAFDTVTERAGVCRDFAHLGVALCRALGIPARFVTGYAHRLESPDFHAYFEAFLGDHWYPFDATRLAPLEGLVRIGAGADAAHAPFAWMFGAAEPGLMNIWAEEQ